MSDNDRLISSGLRNGGPKRSEKLKIYIGFALCGLLLADSVYAAAIGERESWRIVIGFIPLILAYHFWRRLQAYKAEQNG